MNKPNKYFLSVGRLEYQKGYDLLIDIFKKFKTHPQTYNWKLLLVGEGNQRKKLETKIINFDLTQDIILTGATTNIKKYYAMSEIFLMTSRWEGMPLVIDEALFFQLPIIAFDCETGPREMIVDGVNGFLVPLGDEDLFVKTMIALSQDNLLLTKIKQGCSLSIEQRSDRAIFTKWNNLFNQLKKQQ
jgi:glycosyltransferase involved in cell wall biosynthesis